LHFAAWSFARVYKVTRMIAATMRETALIASAIAPFAPGARMVYVVV
jgi:hypothetical protein